jgi:hypothetical protein
MPSTTKIPLPMYKNCLKTNSNCTYGTVFIMQDEFFVEGGGIADAVLFAGDQN